MKLSLKHVKSDYQSTGADNDRLNPWDVHNNLMYNNNIRHTFHLKGGVGGVKVNNIDGKVYNRELNGGIKGGHAGNGGNVGGNNVIGSTNGNNNNARNNDARNEHFRKMGEARRAHPGGKMSSNKMEATYKFIKKKEGRGEKLSITEMQIISKFVGISTSPSCSLPSASMLNELDAKAKKERMERDEKIKIKGGKKGGGVIRTAGRARE